MLPYAFYKIIHLFGLGMAVTGLGGLAFAGADGLEKESSKTWKLASLFHGIGLFLVLLGGMGMIKGNFGAGWVHGKFALWFLFGAAMMVPRRKPALAKPLFFALPVLVALGAWLGGMQPGA